MRMHSLAVLAFIAAAACHGDAPSAPDSSTSPFGHPSPHPDMAMRFGFIQWNSSYTEHFCSEIPGACKYQLGTVELSGNNRRYVNLPGALWNADLSRDGSLFAQASGRSIIVADTTGAVRSILDTTAMYLVSNALFSLDGRVIYFNGVRAPGEQNYIWRVNLDGSGLAKVADVPVWRFRSIDYRTGGAASRDGTKIAFVDSVTLVMRVLDLSSGQTTVLANGKPGIAPEFSPDGTRVAYLGLNAMGNSDRTVIATVDGSASLEIGPIFSPYWRNRLSWTPDGNWVLELTQTGLSLLSATDGEEILIPHSNDLYQPVLP